MLANTCDTSPASLLTEICQISFTILRALHLSHITDQNRAIEYVLVLDVFSMEASSAFREANRSMLSSDRTLVSVLDTPSFLNLWLPSVSNTKPG